MKYTIGIDYGTLSARALLIQVTDGKEIASSEFKYPHGVMDRELPCGTPLGDNVALQHPQDYIDALCYTISEIIKKGNVAPCDIVGIGIDFTACTMLPIDKNGTPLCFDDRFKSTPYAYAKLWKHHAASAEAELITKVAKDSGEKWLDTYGGKVSSEWLLPKMLETYNISPEIYNSADYFIEAGDWIIQFLTGNLVRSSCFAGYKGLWNKQDGYPSKEFMIKLDESFGETASQKLSGEVLPTGTLAGTVCDRAAAMTGLAKGTSVCVPIIDAHASLPAAGIVDEDKLLLIIGTSTCHIVMSNESKDVPGICGRVDDGVVSGFVAYEAGQACVGDSFDWFVKACTPAKYENEAASEGISIFDLLERKATALGPGGSRLLALDWWNGNRTPYADYDLTGAILGLNLMTKPEQIYRALIESTAFGTRRIVDLYNNYGVPIKEIYAAGGISQKSELLMQIYADVLGCEIKVPLSQQSGALGGALFAAVAAGTYDNMKDAANAMLDTEEKIYKPDMNNHKIYDKLYIDFCKLSEYFANDNNILKNL